MQQKNVYIGNYKGERWEFYWGTQKVIKII